MVKIVFIDDEKTSLELLNCVIDWESIGFTVSGTATDGYTGLVLCAAVNPHVVIVDINMPKMDGLTFIKEIRKRDESVKIIILSAYDESEYAWSLGISAYLLKPLDEDRMVEIMLGIKNRINNNGSGVNISGGRTNVCNT